MTKTILVTGYAGFIGSSFTKQFSKKFPKTEIIGIDDFSTGRKDAVLPSIAFYKGSILDETVLNKIFSKHKPEYVFHFAALPRVSYSVEHPRLTSEVNIVGTVALLEISKKHNVKRFIYSSSSAVYGLAKKIPTPESEPANPLSPYAFQKYAGEKFCKMFSELYNLDTVSLRYFNVFGPGQYGDSPYSTVIAAWLEAIYFPEIKKGFIEGDGKQAKDICFIDNVVDANILAMKHKKKLNGEIFNIANSNPISINEIWRMLEKFTEKKLELEQRPPRKGDVRFTHSDISKAKRIFGYTPKIKFEEGLIKTIDWFKKRSA